MRRDQFENVVKGIESASEKDKISALNVVFRSTSKESEVEGSISKEDLIRLKRALDRSFRKYPPKPPSTYPEVPNDERRRRGRKRADLCR